MKVELVLGYVSNIHMILGAKRHYSVDTVEDAVIIIHCTISGHIDLEAADYAWKFE